VATRYQYAKDYLSQALYINQSIKSKTAQVESLRELTTSTTAKLTGMPRNPNPNYFDDYINKSLALEAEIAADLAALIDLKAEIIGVIKSVADRECRNLLELRYLSFRTWEMVAIEMFCDVRHVYRLHNKALAEVDAILRER